MFGLGIGELLVIGVIALVVIGPKKLPGVAKTLGKGLREFQMATKGLMDQTRDAIDPDNHDQYGEFSKEEVEKALKETGESAEVIEADVVASSESKSQSNSAPSTESNSKQDEEKKKA